MLHGYVGFIFGSIKANPLVVDADDADRVPVLGHRLRHRDGDAALHRPELVAAGRHRHALRRYDRELPASTPSWSTSRSRCST
jgi:hypothetical protein